MDTKWKFARAKMWLNWFYKKSVLPPPLSILYVVLPMCWVIRRLFKICGPEINTKCGRIDEQQVKFSKKIIFYILVPTRQISSLSWHFSVKLLHLSPKMVHCIKKLSRHRPPCWLSSHNCKRILQVKEISQIKYTVYLKTMTN